MSILDINRIALSLVARDFSNGHAPTNAGPTMTSRALAIIHLAAHDAYAKVTSQLVPKLSGLPAPPPGLGTNEATGNAAVLGAGLRACHLLYPDDAAFIDAEGQELVLGVDGAAIFYGEQIARLWFSSRVNDGSATPQLDAIYNPAPGHHHPDTLNPNQMTQGRTWGQVKPFILTNVATDAPLGAPPAITTQKYADAYDDVFKNGRNNLPERNDFYRKHAEVGIFWSYDGSNKLGTPPRLYNQVALATTEFQSASNKNQIRILAAINAAMADAGIAAWHWKYAYDFWRPVVAIREAGEGWGPLHLGDGNTHRKEKGDPFWLPLGAPKSNPFPAPIVGAGGANFTPNFPAYPSGHATFGSACFETLAKLLGKTPETINVKFISDEFNGKTTDNTGATRPEWEATFTLREAIEQNKISRIYLGVHWIFDATGGEIVGKAVSDKVVIAFP